jgi:hypothetical protein
MVTSAIISKNTRLPAGTPNMTFAYPVLINLQ